MKSSFILPCTALVCSQHPWVSYPLSRPPRLSLSGLPACQEGGWRSRWGYPVKDFTKSFCLFVFIPHCCPLRMPAWKLTHWRTLPIVISTLLMLTTPLSLLTSSHHPRRLLFYLFLAHFLLNDAVFPLPPPPVTPHLLPLSGPFDIVCLSTSVVAHAVSCRGNLGVSSWYGGGHRVIHTKTSCCLVGSAACLISCLWVLYTSVTV